MTKLLEDYFNAENDKVNSFFKKTDSVIQRNEYFGKNHEQYKLVLKDLQLMIAELKPFDGKEKLNSLLISLINKDYPKIGLALYSR